MCHRSNPPRTHVALAKHPPFVAASRQTLTPAMCRRSNPPRTHVDPAKQGARYWCYTMNELGMEDVAAQVGRAWSVVVPSLGMGLFDALSVVSVLPALCISLRGAHSHRVLVPSPAAHLHQCQNNAADRSMAAARAYSCIGSPIDLGMWHRGGV